jgi:hypothetical protein
VGVRSRRDDSVRRVLVDPATAPRREWARRLTSTLSTSTRPGQSGARHGGRQGKTPHRGAAQAACAPFSFLRKLPSPSSSRDRRSERGEREIERSTRRGRGEPWRRPSSTAAPAAAAPVRPPRPGPALLCAPCSHF